MAETCSTCRWSRAFADAENAGPVIDGRVRVKITGGIRCHHNAPSAGGFPHVQPDDFCGEWTAREGARIPPGQAVDDHFPHARKMVKPTFTVLGDAPTTPPSEGWIPWAGGECPVAEDTFGMVRFRDGVEIDMPLWLVGWAHMGNHRDIIAYQPRKPADFRLEAGKYYITATGERVGPLRVYGQTGEVPSRLAFCVRHNGCWTEEGDAWGDEKHDIVALAADQGGEQT
jgi:hypothetical protein